MVGGPIPEPTSVGGDDFVFPHRYWVQNEHCQVLNIWTQNTSPSAKKPVMVWMHGGGVTNGSSMESYAYDGKTLSEFGNVVAVSVNHRLNIIGTLDLSAYGSSTLIPATPAWRTWWQPSSGFTTIVESFGGDPGNVRSSASPAAAEKSAGLCSCPWRRAFSTRSFARAAAH